MNNETVKQAVCQCRCHRYLSDVWSISDHSLNGTPSAIGSAIDLVRSTPAQVDMVASLSVKTFTYEGDTPMLTREEVQGSWNQMVSAVQRKYSQLTGDDLAGLKGDVNQLVGVIQRKTGQAREDIETYIRSLSNNASSTMNRVAEAANDYAHVASDKMKEGYSYVQDAAQDGYRVARQTVKQRPVESIAIAFAAGLAAGLITGASLFGSSSNSRRWY